MADNARLEDLRKRYHENPRRFFAPLANEYRKSGFLDRALLLCQKHVPEQPENMNGLVVYGQTLFEMGQTEAAREPFEQALKLDPENLIALRHLGDIARLGGDVPTAKGWYDRVLELDRRNDEVLDLLVQMGVADVEPKSAPSARPSAAISDLISVAPTVSVSGAPGLGMIDLDPPMPAAEPPRPVTPAPAAGKGSTVVINAQALADRDRLDLASTLPSAAPSPSPSPAQGTDLIELASAKEPASVRERPSVSVREPASAASPLVESPSASKPKRRTSLLEIDFDFSETAEPVAAKPVPAAPLLGAEAAEYGFADTDIGDLAPTDAPGGDLIIEPTAQGESLAAPTPAPLTGDFELAEFNAEVSPLAGLEANEFESESVAPLADLEGGSASASVSTVAPLAGLDRPDLTLDEPPPMADGLMPLLDGAMGPDAEPLDAMADGIATDAMTVDAMAIDVPLLDGAANVDALGLPLLEDASADAGAEETPSARAKPRMTKADLASLPLLADFGLDEDEAPADAASASAAASAPAASAPAAEPPSAALVEFAAEPASAASAASSASAASARPSKATPTFVTETMAALYVKQGLLPEAIGVYRQLVEAAPDDAGLKAKLAELERMHAQNTLPPLAEQAVERASAVPPAAAAAAVEMPEFEPSPEIAEPMPAPANAALANVSFGEIALQGQGSALPPMAAAASGPTAREFFATFARRAAVAAAGMAAATYAAAAAPELGSLDAAQAQALLDPSSAPTPLSNPTVVPAAPAAQPQWPLDELFGAATELRDLHAAETLAGVGSYAGTDGGTGIEGLLNGESSSGPQSRRSVPRASEMLKFDQFFQKPGTGAAPEIPLGDATPGDDDLGQFQDWLKGLKK